MPYCDVLYSDESNSTSSEEDKPVRLYYHTYGKGDVRIMLIMGLAAAHGAWKPQLVELSGTLVANEVDDEEDVCCSDEATIPFQSTNENETSFQDSNVPFTGRICCAFDNRGVGKSSVPNRKSAYTTKIMASDVIALANHLKWEKFHVVGHSMGGMIAFKVASLFPDRVLSLTMISVTGGGYETIPKVNMKLLNIFYKFSKAKTPHDRAHVDLETHYSHKFLESDVNGSKRRHLLHKEYVSEIEKSKMQHPDGLSGHFNACWTHSVTKKDVASIKTSKILTSIIHGRDDIIAQIQCAKNLVLKLRPFARMVELPGAHMVTVESREMVNDKLTETVVAAEQQIPPCSWLKSCSLSEKETETEASGSESCSCMCCFPKANTARTENESQTEPSGSVFSYSFWGSRNRLKRRYFSFGENEAPENGLRGTEFVGQVERLFAQEMEKGNEKEKEKMKENGHGSAAAAAAKQAKDIFARTLLTLSRKQFLFFALTFIILLGAFLSPTGSQSSLFTRQIDE